MKEIENLDYRPFTRFCMSISAVPSSYIAGMTIEEQLLWFCSYLEKEVIPAVNNNGEAVEELQGLYVELHNYVEHYFDNLDVQTEINNKLDSMVQDGTLTQMIGDYIDPKFEEFQSALSNFEGEVNTSISNFENGINQIVSNQNNTIQEQNQAISQMDTKISNATSGSPLVASSTSEMINTERIYVNTTNGKWYYYDGDSWEIGGDYQSTGIGENSIDYSMFNNRLKDTIIPNENLIYSVDKFAGVYLNIETGATFSASSYSTTDFIPVKSSTRYYVSFKSSVGGLSNIRMLEYDTNKDYLNVYHSGDTSQEYITTSANTKYIRLSATNASYTNKLILCEYPLVYCENTESLYLDGKNILNDSVDGDTIKNGTLSFEALKEYVVTSNNLYNPNNHIINNYMLNSDTGLIGAMNSFSVTDFQKIEPSTQYTSNYARGFFIYDSNKNYITYASDVSSAPITITTPANACYYRFYCSTSNLNNLKLGKGATAPTDDYSYIIRGIEDNKAIETTNIANLIYDKDTTINIKLLGDSITYGIGASNRLTTSWAALVKSELEAKFNCSVTNSGVSGVGSQYIVDNISTLISNTDDIVICMIGTNNRVSETAFKRLDSDLQTILEYCQDRNIKFVPMCSLPASITDEEREDGTFDVRYGHMEDISHIISAFAQKNNMEYIDLFHDVYNYCFTSGNNLNTLLSDGLHPNDSGYYVMYRYIMHGLGVDAKIQGATW